MNMDIEAMLDLMNMLDLDTSDSDEDDTYSIVKYLRKNKELSNASSLKLICLTSIAKNITYWMTYLPENPNAYLYVMSPLDVLGTADTMTVMKQVIRMKLFRNEHLNLLLHYKLNAMDFSIFSKHGVFDIAFKLMFTRCKRIKDLTIPTARLSLKILNQIPVQYPALEYLKIYREVCQYNFLTLLATHCKNLKLLLIKVCVNIQDQTFEVMKNCSSLCSLSLYHAEHMTCSTFQQILAPMKKLRQLSLVGCKMNFASFNENNIAYDHLTSIDLSWSNVTDYGLKQIVSRMKNLVELYLSRCQNLSTLAFKSISTLRKLQRLAIGYFSRNYELDSNVELCLLRIGLQLQYLDLSGMPHIQPSVIATCCPNLRSLFMNHCLFPNIDWLRLNNINDSDTRFNWLPNNKGYFSLMEVCRCLEQLSISCMHLTYDNLNKLFFATSVLRKLKFLPWPKDASSPISERFFIDFFNEFPFPNLEELDISRNDGVTKKVVLLILKSYPRLKRLQIAGCNLISEELASIKEITELSGLNIIIEVTYYKNMVSTL